MPQISSLNKFFIIEVNHEPDSLLRFAILSIYVCWGLGEMQVGKEGARKWRSSHANIRYCAGNFILSHLIYTKIQVLSPLYRGGNWGVRLKSSLHTQVCLTPTHKLPLDFFLIEKMSQWLRLPLQFSTSSICWTLKIGFQIWSGENFGGQIESFFQTPGISCAQRKFTIGASMSFQDYVLKPLSS